VPPSLIHPLPFFSLSLAPPAIRVCTRLTYACRVSCACVVCVCRVVCAGRAARAFAAAVR
jgi:hypothetical protein